MQNSRTCFQNFTEIERALAFQCKLTTTASRGLLATARE